MELARREPYPHQKGANTIDRPRMFEADLNRAWIEKILTSNDKMKLKPRVWIEKLEKIQPQPKVPAGSRQLKFSFYSTFRLKCKVN